MDLAIFIFLALVAEVLGTLGGFGSSLFFVPIAGYFFDFHSVLGITALFHLSSNVSKIALFREGFDGRLVLNLGVPAVLAVIVGAFLSKYIESKALETILAGFLIATSVFLLVFRQFHLHPTLLNSRLGGLFSGLTAGLVGTGGAIRGITLAAFGLKKEVFIATSAIIDLGIDLSRSVVYAANGYIHGHDLYLVPILLGVGLAGTWVGKWLLGYVSQAQFKYIVLVLILLIGVFTLGQAIFQWQR